MDNTPGGDDEHRTAHAENAQQEPPALPDTLRRMDTVSILSHPRRRYLLYTLNEKRQW